MSMRWLTAGLGWVLHRREASLRRLRRTSRLPAAVHQEASSRARRSGHGHGFRSRHVVGLANWRAGWADCDCGRTAAAAVARLLACVRFLRTRLGCIASARRRRRHYALWSRAVAQSSSPRRGLCQLITNDGLGPRTMHVSCLASLGCSC